MAALLKGGFFALILLAGIAAGEEHSGQIAAGELRSMANSNALEAVALYIRMHLRLSRCIGNFWQCPTTPIIPIRLQR
jgi:hypothetical protein